MRRLLLALPILAMLIAGALLIANRFNVPQQSAAEEPTLAAIVSMVPTHSNIFLTHQHSPDMAPLSCGTGGDAADLQAVVNKPVGPAQLASFELELSFDSSLVCVDLEPGPAWNAAGVTCEVLDKDSGGPPGGARIACTSEDGSAPGDAGLHLADIVVRPQPELYTQILPAQENGVVADVLVLQCSLTDEFGKAIPAGPCESADVNVRSLEADTNGDCRVDVVDGQALASDWFPPGVYPPLWWWPNPRHDLEPGYGIDGTPGDGDIDVKDIQFVWGRLGSTCEAPNPPQLPWYPTGQ